LKRTPISEEQSLQIIDMRVDRSMSCQAIASKLNLHHGAVSWHLLKLGIEKGGKPPSNYRPRNSDECTFTRNGVLVRGFTQRLGRKQNSIRGRLYTLARREERVETSQAADNTPTRIYIGDGYRETSTIRRLLARAIEKLLNFANARG
jgi:DNA-binding transcriptional ArsR family regulator